MTPSPIVSNFQKNVSVGNIHPDQSCCRHGSSISDLEEITTTGLESTCNEYLNEELEEEIDEEVEHIARSFFRQDEDINLDDILQVLESEEASSKPPDNFDMISMIEILKKDVGVDYTNAFNSELNNIFCKLQHNIAKTEKFVKIQWARCHHLPRKL